MKKSYVLSGVLPALTLAGLLCLVSLQTQAADAGGASTVTVKKPELGFLKQIFNEVGGNRDRWVERFCELALSQKGEDYARFVRLVRLESTPLTNEDRRMRPEGSEYFLHYSREDNRRRAFQCLEHGGENAPPDVLYALYFINAKSPSNYAGTRPDYWLKKAAYAGEANAQVDFAMQILHYRHGVSKDTPEELREEIAPERFHYWLKRAADSGLPRGLYELAKVHSSYYEYSRSPALSLIDVPLAIQVLERVARETRDVAMKARADNQSKTWIIPEFIPSDALIRSRAVATLGSLYDSGKHVSQDYTLALKWYSEVDEVYIWHCRAPLAGVRYRLLTMYERGLGTEKNPAKVAYYRQHPRLGC